MLCVPSIPTFYSLADLEGRPVTPNSNPWHLHEFVPLLELCALAVPTGAGANGRPGSVTLIAPSRGRRVMIAAEGAQGRGPEPGRGALPARGSWQSVRA